MHVEEMVMTYVRKDIVLLALVVGLKVWTDGTSFGFGDYKVLLERSGAV